ncbi:LysR family transcriptional regulator [Marinomonas epiphytica]
MNAEYLKLFIRLAATHNISQAGAELGLSPAVASNHLNKLEESLGVRLLHRTTRKVSLSQEGESFLPYAQEVIASMEAARNAVGAGNHSPSGKLRVTAPASFGRMHLVPAIKGFLTQYPDISLELRLSDTIVDMVEGGFDIAIRNAELKDSSLIARKLATDKRVVCAAPSYLAEHGYPQSPKDLDNHMCINLIGVDGWRFKSPQGEYLAKTKAQFQTDNGEAMRDACSAGLGLAINATWSAYKELKSGELVVVLEDHPLAADAAIWAVYPSSRLLAPKVRAFIDYFSSYFGDNPYWDQ